MSRFDAARLEGLEPLSEQRDFDDFYRACREEIARALVLSAGHRDLGLEATDEAFARALERWDEVGIYENPEGWVYRVGVNWARSKLRRRSFTTEGLFTKSVHLDDLPDPELLSAVERLPLEYRSVIVARFFLDWSIEQTAEALSIPEGTVKTRQSRALSRLRRRLGERHES
jgi:RNA polymerase sigma-70 factor (ECF subfamily)